MWTRSPWATYPSMLKLARSFENPILEPEAKDNWQDLAAFNPSVWHDPTGFNMVYRAQSALKPYFETQIKLSTIGYANSPDPIHFVNRKQLITPEYDWEKYGCEDPRMTKIGDTYYIFYTALGGFPFNKDNIKVAVATTKDFSKIEEKHLPTPFNAKGACLFPEKIRGKYALLLTVDTERPPSKIAVAYFDEIEDLWNEDKWKEWYKDADSHKLDLIRSPDHQVEVGAVPIKTKYGWLLIHSYIRDYLKTDHKFGIEAAILDTDNPQKIVGRKEASMLEPREQYELFGNVPYTIFPSGAVVYDDELNVYYGAADTVSAVASVNFESLLSSILLSGKTNEDLSSEKIKFTRFPGNPVLEPIGDHDWESKYVYNPAAIYLSGYVHIVYRAQGESMVSTLGYARLKDGVKVVRRLDKPIYAPRIKEEKDGCEDPRITKIGNTLYMFYTAYHDGQTHIAMTTISVSDFLHKKWNWSPPQIISPGEINDKNACILPEKINGKYIIFHRTNHRIWIAEEDNLDFSDGRWIQGNILLEPTEGTWYTEKVGITGPPIKTTQGWLLIFHGLSKEDNQYRFGAMLLDLKNPLIIKAQLGYPVFEPETKYERTGLRPDAVFSCGNAVIGDKLYIYYGAGDTTVAIAWVELPKLLDALSKQSSPQ